MRLETRIFTCFVLTLILIFLTGCHSIKWEWLPKKDKFGQKDNLKPPFSIRGTKMDERSPQGVTILKGSF